MKHYGESVVIMPHNWSQSPHAVGESLPLVWCIMCSLAG